MQCSGAESLSVICLPVLDAKMGIQTNTKILVYIYNRSLHTFLTSKFLISYSACGVVDVSVTVNMSPEYLSRSLLGQY